MLFILFFRGRNVVYRLCITTLNNKSCASPFYFSLSDSFVFHSCEDGAPRAWAYTYGAGTAGPRAGISARSGHLLQSPKGSLVGLYLVFLMHAAFSHLK